MDTGLARLLRAPVGRQSSLAIRSYASASAGVRPRFRFPAQRSVLESLSKNPRLVFMRGIGVVAVYTVLQMKDPVTTCAGEAKDSSAGPSKGDDDAVAKAIAQYGPLGTEITVGAILGFSSGYAVKKVGKLAAFLIGITFVATQFAVHSGVLDINWRKVESDVLKVLDQDGDSKLDKNDLLAIWQKVKKVLVYQLPSSGGFIAGFAVGFIKG